MRILVTNDDGYYAPGLQQLTKALEDIADVTVVAPDRNHSGASSALTLKRPIRVNRVAPHHFIIDGTPTDCVHLAVTGLLEQPADLVVSGINHGSNLGDDVFYSGTVAAAMEGRFLGLSSIAVSLCGTNPTHYAVAAQVACDLVERIIKHSLGSDTILNVNVPDVGEQALAGYDVTRLGKRHCAEPVIKQIDPRGQEVYWIGLPGAAEDAGPGTDFFAIESQKVSVTPIQLDMTNYKVFDRVAKWLD